MPFDADAHRAAHAPWSMVLRGRTHTARPVSVRQVMAFQEVAQREPAVARRALIRLLRVAFPWRPWYVWRGDPVRWLVAETGEGQAEALADFFGCLLARLTRTPPTSGTGSPAPTPPLTPGLTG